MGAKTVLNKRSIPVKMPEPIGKIRQAKWVELTTRREPGGGRAWRHDQLRD